MRLAVDGAGYRSAAQAFVHGNQQAARAGLALTDGLSGSAGMAGDDATAAGFAASYDEAAAAAVEVLAGLVDAFTSLARLSEASLRNHVAAEEASALPDWLERVVDPPTAADRSTVVHLPAPPSALGSDGSSLPGWADVVLDILEGVFWPDADTDRLRQAATTWRTAATSVGLLSGHCASALGELSVEASPEVPLAVATTEDLRSRVESLCAQLDTLASACDEYAAQVDAKRAEILDVLEGLAWELGIGAVVSGALTFLTAGGAAGVAGGAGAARVAAASARLRGILESLGLLSRGTAATLRPVSATLRDTRVYLARLSAARTERGSANLGSFFGRGRLEAGWLSKHEAGRQGHTMAKHVGRSRKQLAQRFVAEPDRRLSSTFFDQATAERAIERVLRQSRHAIDEWTQSSRSQLPLRGDAGSVVGHVLVRETGELVESSRIRVVIVRDASMPDGWRLKTAYPDLVKGGRHD